MLLINKTIKRYNKEIIYNLIEASVYLERFRIKNYKLYLRYRELIESKIKSENLFKSNVFNNIEFIE